MAIQDPPMPPLSSTFPRLTNQGIPLLSEFFGGESDTIREIPPEWRAALDLKVTEISIPFDRPLFELDDEVLSCKAERTVTSERKMRTTRKPAGMFTLVEKFTDKNKEFGTRTRNFRFIDDLGSISTPSATQEVHTRNFGNKHFEEVIEAIPALFVADEYDRSRPVVTPEDFRALLEEDEHGFTEIGIAADPSSPLPPGVISHRDTQQDVYTHRESIRAIDLLSLPQEIINSDTNQFKQVKTIFRILDLESVAPLLPTALRDVKFTKLGDGTALTIYEDVPNVFDNIRYVRSRPVVTPEDFRALLQEDTVTQTLPGNAADPTIVPGDGIVEASDEQLTDFTHRTSARTLDLLGLPQFIFNLKTNQYKQPVVVERKLDLDSVTPPAPTALTDVTFTVLGDGTALTVVDGVSALFADTSSTTELPDLLPEIFKAVLPVFIKEFKVTGTIVDPPVLTTGDFEKTEHQYDEFNKTIRTKGRAGISYPQNVVASRQIGGLRFGGEVTKLAGTLDNSEPPVETGLDIVTSEVTNLGNNTWFRKTEKLDTALFWPILPGTSFDREMQIFTAEETQTVDASYTVTVPSVGDFFVETLKPTDQWHGERKKITKTPTAISKATAIVEEVEGPHQFPGIIYAVTGGYYRRQASAQLCQQILRTWWLSSATKPTRGLPGSGADVEIQDIIMDDIIISQLNDVTKLEYSGMCLHDAITTFGTFVYPATVPSATAYIAMIGTEIVVGGTIETTDIPFLWKIQTKSVIAR